LTALRVLTERRDRFQRKLKKNTRPVELAGRDYRENVAEMAAKIRADTGRKFDGSTTEELPLNQVIIR